MCIALVVGISTASVSVSRHLLPSDVARCAAFAHCCVRPHPLVVCRAPSCPAITSPIHADSLPLQLQRQHVVDMFVPLLLVLMCSRWTCSCAHTAAARQAGGCVIWHCLFSSSLWCVGGWGCRFQVVDGIAIVTAASLAACSYIL